MKNVSLQMVKLLISKKVRIYYTIFCMTLLIIPHTTNLCYQSLHRPTCQYHRLHLHFTSSWWWAKNARNM